MMSNPIPEHMEEIILVDDDDNAIGQGQKIDVHRRGALHRAFSIIIRNSAGDLLLQRRAEGKYHSGGLWTNACCGHPRPGEATDAAALRRLREEMGFTCLLTPLGAVRYYAELDRGMIEHEIAYIYAGTYDGPVAPDPREAGAYAWHGLNEIRSALAKTPDRFSVWFRRYIDESWPVARHPAT
jgi:isopentenyl-diphosphate delta-isomerase